MNAGGGRAGGRCGAVGGIGEVLGIDGDMTYLNEQIPEFVQLLEKDETID